MIDAHLLLNLGRPDSVAASGEGSPLLTPPGLPSPAGGKFAEALRQVHAAGRQDLAGAPMQLRIIGSTLRVVTPARVGSEGAAMPSPEAPQLQGVDAEEHLDLERPTPEAIVALAMPEGSAQVTPSLKPSVHEAQPTAQLDPVELHAPLAPRFLEASRAVSEGPDASLPLEGGLTAPVVPASQVGGRGIEPTSLPDAARGPASPLSQAPALGSSALEPNHPLGEVKITALSQRSGVELQPSAMEPKMPASSPAGDPVKQVALGAAAALSLRESLKQPGDPAPKAERLAATPPTTQKPSNVPAPRLAEGWTFKQQLQGDGRLGSSKPLERSTLPKAAHGEAPRTSAAPLVSQLVPPERRELDLVALAKAAPLEGPDGRDLSEKFAAQVAQRVVAQAAAGQLTSRVALNPAQLGPLEIRLQLEGDRLAVDFQVQHALTRELLGDGLGRLREGLEQAGFEVTRLTAEGRGSSVPSSQPAQASWAGSPSDGQDGQGFAQYQGGAGFAGREREGSRAQDQHAPQEPPQGKGQDKDGSGLDITV